MKKTKNSNSEKRALTPEQRVFCRLVAVENVKPAVAYMQTFNCKPASAYTLAGRLLKKVEVIEEIERLTTQTQQKCEQVSIWTKLERMEKLQEWAQACADRDDIPNAVKCVDVLNKMDGSYETKSEAANENGGLHRAMPQEVQNTAASILSKVKEAHERRLASSECSHLRV